MSAPTDPSCADRRADLLESSPPEPLVCSSKGCRATATNALLWNNPKLHTPERRKVWLACPDHTATLADFLSLRGLLKDTVTVDDVPPDAG